MHLIHSIQTTLNDKINKKGHRAKAILWIESKAPKRRSARPLTKSGAPLFGIA